MRFPWPLTDRLRQRECLTESISLCSLSAPGRLPCVASKSWKGGPKAEPCSAVYGRQSRNASLQQCLQCCTAYASPDKNSGKTSRRPRSCVASRVLLATAVRFWRPLLGASASLRSRQLRDASLFALTVSAIFESCVFLPPPPPPPPAESGAWAFICTVDSLQGRKVLWDLLDVMIRDLPPFPSDIRCMQLAVSAMCLVSQTARRCRDHGFLFTLSRQTHGRFEEGNVYRGSSRP